MSPFDDLRDLKERAESQGLAGVFDESAEIGWVMNLVVDAILELDGRKSTEDPDYTDEQIYGEDFFLP